MQTEEKLQVLAVADNGQIILNGSAHIQPLTSNDEPAKTEIYDLPPETRQTLQSLPELQPFEIHGGIVVDVPSHDVGIMDGGTKGKIVFEGETVNVQVYFSHIHPGFTIGPDYGCHWCWTAGRSLYFTCPIHTQIK